LLFSGKEAVFKAWFPMTGRWLDFKDAEVTVDPFSGAFNAKILLAASDLRRLVIHRPVTLGFILPHLCVIVKTLVG